MWLTGKYMKIKTAEETIKNTGNKLLRISPGVK